MSKVIVIGIGGRGITAIDHMISSGLSKVEFLAIDTERASVDRSLAPVRLFIGTSDTSGGPSVSEVSFFLGQREPEIRRALEEATLVFVVTCLGGRTSTAAAPLVASIAQSIGALTVAVVSVPFASEGEQLARQALHGLRALKESDCATVIIGPPNYLRPRNFSSVAAVEYEALFFRMKRCVQALSDVTSVYGPFNLSVEDLGDVFSGICFMGMGTGKSHTGGRRVPLEAEKEAIGELIFQGGKLDEARSVFAGFGITKNMGINEIQTAVSFLRQRLLSTTNLVFGAVENADDTDEFRITLIASGFELDKFEQRFLAALTAGNKSIGESKSDEDKPEIFVVWDPEVVATEDYASLIESIGDLVRLEGGVGVKRIRNIEIEMPVSEELLV